MEEQEYIVSLKNFEDLEEFYDDMETSGGTLYIPDRIVDCSVRRAISRNTHYTLTESEATQLRKDPRVLTVERLPKDRGIETTPFWTQGPAAFEKSSAIDQADKNWGLLRLIEGGPYSSWGTDGAFTQRNATIQTTSSGKDVDIVIVDAHINRLHPEFAVNADGTGGSRVIQFDWFSLSEYLDIPTTGAYNYSVSVRSNHGTHVAGTAAGNTQGWARDSNIYYIEFNYTAAGGTFTPGSWDLYLFDYIRAFHLTKPINPSTGRRNPTICNNSWGYSYGNISLGDIFQVQYRGVISSLANLSTVTKKSALEESGVPVPFDTYLFKTPARVTALDLDVADAIEDGVIIVGSAGNSYWNCARPGTADYNNTVTAGQQIFHSRGSSPSAAEGAICVGSVGARAIEYKSTFSNYGNRIDAWAPGSNIISGVFDASAASEFGITLAFDPRDPNYRIGSISGTSMSGPQISGLLACLAEQFPNMSQSQALSYLQTKSRTGQVISSGGNAGDYTSLGDATTGTTTKHALYNYERPLVGHVTPKPNFGLRATSGQTFPRFITQRTK